MAEENGITDRGARQTIPWELLPDPKCLDDIFIPQDLGSRLCLNKIF